MGGLVWQTHTRARAHTHMHTHQGPTSVCSARGLHGDELDLGSYLAYWKPGLLLTFREGGGGVEEVGGGGWEGRGVRGGSMVSHFRGN